MSLTKVVATSGNLLTMQSVTSNTVVIGSTISVLSDYEVAVRIRVGRGTSSAFTTAPIFRLEGSGMLSPTADQWDLLAQFQCAIGANLGSQALTAGITAGDSTATVAAVTNFAAADFVVIHDPTVGNSEFKHVLSAASTTITFWDACVRSHAITTSTVRDQAEEYFAILNVAALQNIRLIVDASGSGQACIVEADYAQLTGL